MAHHYRIVVNMKSITAGAELGSFLFYSPKKVFSEDEIGEELKSATSALAAKQRYSSGNNPDPHVGYEIAYPTNIDADPRIIIHGEMFRTMMMTVRAVATTAV